MNIVSAGRRRMIISRTPMRITFVGGGTDLPEYYKRYGPGAVISAAVNKYVYINVNKRFDNSIRVGYAKTEIVDKPEDIQHPTVRESLKLLGIDGGIEITTMADIPAGGTGMGSSSSFLVGLLNALHAWKGEYAGPTELAEEAVKIERRILKEPGGKQDQYMASFGGLQFMEFERDESVRITPIIMSEESREKLHSSLLLVYTGVQRSSASIHTKQTAQVEMHLDAYKKMVDIARGMFNDLTKNNWEASGRHLKENWDLKRTLSDNITDAGIDKYCNAAIASGAVGCKVIGAGGGGFMLFFANPDKHQAIINSLSGLRIEPFEFTYTGSRIVYVGD
ncbi:MAG: GHMP family kinase ATP-binding protein [Candidatus Micrarchaeaceae archaeon]